MSKNKELMAIGATAAGLAAAAAGYSLFKNKDIPDQPKKTLLENAKDNIFEKEVKNASAAMDIEVDKKDSQAASDGGFWTSRDLFGNWNEEVDKKDPKAASDGGFWTSRDVFGNWNDEVDKKDP